MFIYKKLKLVGQAKNPHWIFNKFIGRELQGRISLLSDGSIHNYQIKHPSYNNWFNVPKDIVEVVNVFESDSEFQIKRLYDWIMDENREPANTKFTSGWLRNVAREIEFRIKK